MPKGGPNRGQGRKPKPPALKYRKLSISLPPGLFDRLQLEAKPSKLIQQLLAEYYQQDTPK